MEMKNQIKFLTVAVIASMAFATACNDDNKKTTGGSLKGEIPVTATTSSAAGSTSRRERRCA